MVAPMDNQNSLRIVSTLPFGGTGQRRLEPLAHRGAHAVPVGRRLDQGVAEGGHRLAGRVGEEELDGVAEPGVRRLVLPAHGERVRPDGAVLMVL